ncbi:hypothetical protein O9H85_23540 [Paenibacillus filicis]|uniref:DUF624 domain-containing protein n=1 Tax=Paenibacillus gyeongsangnamensis TaxID=3388067 RepID=A0ABT4QEL5_9BACL|nr:hypothetical protein [Paenibacillus filicis]MCZ8515329.1 hypothetical protein [Paenibacillus filicis]
MLNQMLEFYDKRQKLVEGIIESIYFFSMTVLIFVSHNVDGFIESHTFKFFAAMYMSFGLWTYEMKNHAFKKMLIDLFVKFSGIFAAAIVIAKLTGVVKLTGLYSSVFYPLTVVILYMLANRKSKWGSDFHGSSAEYLNHRFGRAVSVVPKIILFFAVLVPGILNASVKMFLISLVIGFAIEYIFVAMCFRKNRPKKLEA